MSLPARKFRFVAVLIAAILVGSGHSFGDDRLAFPDSGKKAEEDFPLKVRLLGYIQQSGRAIALIQIGDGTDALTFVLRQGRKLPIELEGYPDASSIRFDEIDHDNRSTKLVFEGPYQPKTCRMLPN